MTSPVKAVSWLWRAVGVLWLVAAVAVFVDHLGVDGAKGWGTDAFLACLFTFAGGILIAAAFYLLRYSRHAWGTLIAFSLAGIGGCAVVAITGPIRWEYRALVGLGILPCLYSLRVLLSRDVRGRVWTQDIAELVDPGGDRIGGVPSRVVLMGLAAILVRMLFFVDEITTLSPMVIRGTILAALVGAATTPIPFLYMRQTRASKVLASLGTVCGVAYFIAKIRTYDGFSFALLEVPVFLFAAGVVLALAVFHMAVHVFSKGADRTGFGYTMLVLAPAVLCSGYAVSGDIGLAIVLLTASGAAFLFGLYAPKSDHSGRSWLRIGHATVVGAYLAWELSLMVILTPASLAGMAAVQAWGLRKRVDGAGILSIGVVAYLLTCLWSLFAEELHGSLAFLYGTVIFTGAMSVFIARRFVHTLADNARKTQELEEARRLQLSLLPDAVPQSPNVDIAWEMQTATQVGGDYYDYSLMDDGTLTLCLGDATGHGMDAGVVVIGTKSLFQTFADAPSITDSLTVMSNSLKGMDLPRMGMAMTILRVKDTTCTVSSAGMPSVMIYRAGTGEVQEVELAGFPLGLSATATYQEESFGVAPDDVILIMTDGLPERLNPRDEYFDYDRATALFKEVAKANPQEIVERMLQAGEEWAEGRPQDDDITLVVLKAK